MRRISSGRALGPPAIAVLLLGASLAWALLLGGLAEGAAAAGAPSIEESSALEVNATSAKLQAELNPQGLASEYRFEYGPSSAYGSSAPVPDAGAGGASQPVSVTETIQGLSPQSTYHYRLVAHNALGETLGPDRTFRTQGPAEGLPDARAWEMVSPQNKHGAPLEPITNEGGLIQSSPGGGSFAYVALGPVDEDPPGVRSPQDSQLLATRTASGWQTEDLATPHEEISILHAGFQSEYKLFAEDLSAAIVEPEGVTKLSAQTTERTPYERELGGGCAVKITAVPSPCYVPLVTAANVLAGVQFGGETEADSGQWGGGVEFLTATPDLSHVLLSSGQEIASGFAPGFVAKVTSLYELSGGQLQLVSVLPGGKAAAEAGLEARAGFNNINMRGAISEDGSRVFFATPGKAHLYMRDSALGQSVQLDAVQAGAAGGSGEPHFQGASSDGQRAFFTDEARLTSDSTAAASKPDLYMCEVRVSAGQLSCALSDLSVDPSPGQSAALPKEGTVTAIDRSGEHVYFAAGGALTSQANAQGERAAAGKCVNREREQEAEEAGEGEELCNLYAYDTSTHQISLVAVLSGADAQDWAQPSDLTAGSSPDGRYLAFMSRRSLSGYENRDARSGQPDEEVYLYDAQSKALRCVSCDPSGARPQGVFDPGGFPGLLVDHRRSWEGAWLAGSLPGWTSRELGIALYQSRYLSDSGRLFFNSPDALSAKDTNGLEDVYEYEPAGLGSCSAQSGSYAPSEGGCVSLISSGTSSAESAFLDASESGDDAFFLTAGRLVPQLDVDGAFDVYDAHACSGASPCIEPAEPSPACEGDSCQSPGQAPGEASIASLAYAGPGNLPAPLASPAPTPAPKPLSRAQKLARALKACRARHKGRRAKHARSGCEAHARALYAAKGKGKARSSKARGAKAKGAKAAKARSGR